LFSTRARIQEVKKLKKNRVLSTMLAMVAAILMLSLTACSLTGESTTTAGGAGTTVPGSDTTVAVDPAVAAADAAIAAVTKSPDIATPATLKAGVLQAGSDVSFPPMELTAGKNAYVGFDVDLCTAIAKKLGLTLEIVPSAWDHIASNLTDNQFDFIMSAVVITPELQTEMSFTEQYLPLVLTISAPTSAPIADSGGLVGKTVGVQVDTIGQSEVATIEGVAEIKPYATILQAFRDLAAGRIQAVVTEEVVSDYLLKNDPDFKTTLANTGKIVTDTGYGYATRTADTALLTALNSALAELRADGVYEKISAKWGVAAN
jgi:polar amino acid transport system substrate-binding protein